MTLLIGFVGGLAAVALKGGVDLYFERRRDRASNRAAARLVAEEFSRLAAWIEVGIQNDRWTPVGVDAFSHATWDANKSALATRLDDDRWRIVTLALLHIPSIEALQRPVALDDPDEAAVLQLLASARQSFRSAELRLLETTWPESRWGFRRLRDSIAFRRQKRRHRRRVESEATSK